MLSNIVTYGYGTEPKIVTGGYHTSAPWITQVLEKLEKTSVGYTYIDYLYVEPGLADYTLMDKIMESLE